VDSSDHQAGRVTAGNHEIGQQTPWTPHGSALYWSWTFIAAGWILTTAVVATLTGIFRRD
jgi:hypothetical protein